MQKEMMTHSPEETEAVGAEVARELSFPAFIALYGDLGVGKTAFVRGLASVLAPSSAVRSPTFALVNEYIGDTINLYHFDMYRIRSEWDLESCGFYDYDFESNVAAVEWSENIEKYLSGNIIIISINALDEHKREITLEGDERFASAWN